MTSTIGYCPSLKVIVSKAQYCGIFGSSPIVIVLVTGKAETSLAKFEPRRADFGLEFGLFFGSSNEPSQQC